jgi:hypothetical protein
MSDADLKAKWATITDPREALAQLVEHSMFLGTDPYYTDLNDALMAMAERVSKPQPHPDTLIIEGLERICNDITRPVDTYILHHGRQVRDLRQQPYTVRVGRTVTGHGHTLRDALKYVIALEDGDRAVRPRGWT